VVEHEIKQHYCNLICDLGHTGCIWVCEPFCGPQSIAVIFSGVYCCKLGMSHRAYISVGIKYTIDKKATITR